MNVPRTTRRRWLIFVSGLGLAMLVLAILAFGTAYSNWQLESVLASTGAITQGTVTNLYSTEGRYPQYWVDYTFRLGSPDDVIEESGSQAVSPDFYNRLTVGASVPIRYSRDNAAIFEIEGQEASVTSPLCVGVLILIGVVICGVALVRLRRQRPAL